jgi:hypothetical protein
LLVCFDCQIKPNFFSSSTAVPPQLCLPDDFDSSLVMNEGSSRAIEIPFLASPQASEIVWYWNGNRGVPDAGRRTVPQNDMKGKAILKLNKVERSDAGKYEVVIRNEFGEVKAIINLKVLSTPGFVRSLEANAKSPKEAVLVWQPPAKEDEGGSPVTKYRIEQRQITPGPGETLRSRAREWNLIGTVDAKSISEEGLLVYHAVNLTEGASYLFGVSAENEIGTGIRKEIPESLLMKSPFGKWFSHCFVCFS